MTPRTTAVVEAFGLGVDEEPKFPVLDVELKIRPTDVVYVTGARWVSSPTNTRTSISRSQYDPMFR